MENNPEDSKSIIIRPGDDFSDINTPVILTDSEFAIDIWLYKIPEEGDPFISGLYRDGIINRLKTLGYYKRFRDKNNYFFLKEKNNIIEQVEPVVIKDEAFDYIKNILGPLEFTCHGYNIIETPEKLRELFLRQSHLIFNETFLENLNTHIKPILKDDKNKSYFFFKNTIVTVTKSGVAFSNYNEIGNNCIWLNHIKEYNLVYTDSCNDCHFASFINNVTNNEEDRKAAFISAIGYLLHNFSHPSRGQAVIAYDEDISDLKNPMGGTGKGLFANAIKQLRDVVKIDGKKFDTKDKFKFQDLNDSTQVVWLDDVRPELGFETFHSCLTDGWSIEKKFKAQFFIKPEDSPKTIICSNSILKGDGTTNKRRQFPIEFSNHYSSKIKDGVEEPIKTEHGCIFFDKDDWDEDEWNKFYSFMIQCSLFYFQHGLVTYEFHNLNQNKLIQSTSDDFCEWLSNQNLEVDIQYDIKNLFEDFRNTYYGITSDFKQRSFTNWLKKYANIKGWQLVLRKSNGLTFIVFQNKK